jgi:hypothetical protein
MKSLVRMERRKERDESKEEGKREREAWLLRKIR